MARYDTPEFISELNLDPNEWHAVGEPAPKATSANEPAPSAASLITPGRNSQGQVVPAAGRDSVEWTIAVVGPNGQTRLVTMRPTGPGLNAANVGLNQLEWNVSGIDETIKPPTAGQTPAQQNAQVAEAQANAATAKSNADIAAANLKKVQEDTREREYNQSQGAGYLTHEELRKAQADAAANNLNADQLKARITEIENNNRNTARSNEIAALNASTAAANSATDASRQVAQAKYEQGLLDNSSADANLNAMKFEHQKAEDEKNQRNIETKQKLDALTQQQANDINQGTLAARTAEGAETARSNAATLAQRQVEAQQTAETAAQAAATSAAANVFGTERQAQTAAGTVGGNLLANRATAANQVLNSVLGLAGSGQSSSGRYGPLGGGLHAMPAGFDATQMLQGIQGYTGGMFGGQQTLDAAARMVRGAAPGAELTPYGQAAIGVLQQMFDKYHAMSGAPHPAAAATAAAAASAANGGAVAPVTGPPVQPTVPTEVPPQPMPVSQQDMLTAGMMQQRNLHTGGYVAPPAQGAAPTIVINA